ncbi:diguanylate cyclase [Pseudothauera nasutitermitis]|uniref:diguanylate cyclase n=1 Tax=Pseudothauera nasutitermitis TaxID=2565930 RepID=UPI001E421F46|nr:diguanylate cyclase [Pseudothauera nasutitermitis]
MLPRLTLRQRLLLVVLLPAAVLAGVIASLFVARGTQAADDALRERGLAIVSFLAPAAEYGVISGNRSTLTTLIQAVLEQRDVAAAAIYDRAGELLAISGRPRLAAPERIRAASEAGVLEKRDDRLTLAAPVITAPLVVDDLDGGFAGSPALQPVIEVGWVYVELDTRALSSEKRTIVFTTLALSLGVLALTAALAVRLARAVTEPVGRLAAAVSSVAAGRREITVPDNADIDEMRALQRGFNAMARSIDEAQQTLQSKVDEATAQLAYQAMHDPLTGLPNRRAFEQALEESVAGSRRIGDQGALCFIDLDRFKVVNDTCGHAAGDELLRRIARLIHQRVRANDLICRVGGDEFALILHGCNAEEALHIAEGLRETVAAFRFNWQGRRFSVGASVGLVRIDGALDSASDVLVAADLACYAAKKSGRNRVVEHEHACGPACHGGDGPAGGDVLSFDRLHLFVQPIVSLQGDAAMPWHEVLLRVSDEKAGEARSSGDLLARLESAAAGYALDLWVAEQTCRRLAVETVEGGEALARCGLNLTRATLLRAGQYLQELAATLQRYHVAPARILLEFPAALAEQCPAESAELVRGARELGCGVVLERLDGGNAAVLARLRPDYAKISLKMLAEHYGLEAASNLAQALCSTAAVLAISTIASEVEDEAQRESLRDFGFDWVQGFSAGVPRPLD